MKVIKQNHRLLVLAILLVSFIACCQCYSIGNPAQHVKFSEVGRTGPSIAMPPSSALFRVKKRFKSRLFRGAADNGRNEGSMCATTTKTKQFFNEQERLSGKDYHWIRKVTNPETNPVLSRLMMYVNIGSNERLFLPHSHDPPFPTNKEMI
jgi:hypothetical protein